MPPRVIFRKCSRPALVKNIGQTVYNQGKVSRKGETTIRADISPLERDSLYFVFVEMIRDKAWICFGLTKDIAFYDTIEFYLFIFFPPSFLRFTDRSQKFVKIFDSLLELRFNQARRWKRKGTGMKWNMFIDTTRKNFRFDAYPHRIRFYKAIFGGRSKIELSKLNSR